PRRSSQAIRSLSLTWYSAFTSKTSTLMGRNPSVATLPPFVFSARATASNREEAWTWTRCADPSISIMVTWQKRGITEGAYHIRFLFAIDKKSHRKAGSPPTDASDRPQDENPARWSVARRLPSRYPSPIRAGSSILPRLPQLQDVWQRRSQGIGSFTGDFPFVCDGIPDRPFAMGAISKARTSAQPTAVGVHDAATHRWLQLSPRV